MVDVGDGLVRLLGRGIQRVGRLGGVGLGKGDLGVGAVDRGGGGVGERDLGLRAERLQQRDEALDVGARVGLRVREGEADARLGRERGDMRDVRREQLLQLLALLLGADDARDLV